MTDEPHAPCAYCQGEVIRFKGETRKRWSRRRACSVPCANRLRSKARRKLEVTPQLCAVCNDEFTIRSDESPRQFSRRQTCGKPDCYSELMARRCGGRTHEVNRADWHRETWPVDYAGGFGRATIEPGDTRGHIPLRPATHVQKQSSIA